MSDANTKRSTPSPVPQFDAATIKSRSQRSAAIFKSYLDNPKPRYFARPAYAYSDPFGNPLFWMWLMDQNQEVRDLWIYHHQDQLDSHRFAELTNKDPNLKSRLQGLEIQAIQQDSGYSPPGLDRDLQYSDEIVAPSPSVIEPPASEWLSITDVAVSALLLLMLTTIVLAILGKRYG